jgi:aspartyl-tRNA(Asn)/glutamyl-tRNA(Gln) amidotransferase subunit A
MKANLNHIKSVNKKYNIFTSLRNKDIISDPSLSYSPLENTTYAIKDNFTTRNEPTTCSSKILAPYISPFDSTVVTLLNQSGSSCIGKTNMDEFAMGNSTVSGYFGPTLNPAYEQDQDLVESYQQIDFYTKDSISETDGEVISKEILNGNNNNNSSFNENTTTASSLSSHSYFISKLHSDSMERISKKQRIVGGSSGGSAAAVALNLVDFSIGSDTGGSVRLPACYTNIYGFKPTYGRISRWGLVAYSQSLDTVGIMSKNVDTIWKVFTSLDLSDSKDPSCLSDSTRESIAIERLNSKKNVGKKFKVGIPKEFLLNELNDDVKKSWKELLTKLEKFKLIEVYPISIPSIKYSLPTYYTLVTSEASSNLSRYDGIRYGYRANENECNFDNEPEFITTRDTGFGDEVKRRIILGNYALSSYGYNSHFMKATGVRGMLINEFNKVFRDRNCLIENKSFQSTNGIDMIIVPTTVSKPPLIKDFWQTDPVTSYLNDVFTIPMSLAGLPTMSIPYGGESMGFQLVGQHGQDYKVLEFTRLVESVLEN